MAEISVPENFPDDSAVMLQAVQIAEQGCGCVEPNPMVGAIIVDARRRLIASGFHQQFGGPHAEIRAIKAAGNRCCGADLFVTLEPCSHFGKTPPCADAVIQAGFRRVVIGCSDPAPHVSGRGILRLQEAGVPVVVGVAQTEAERLIAPFRLLHQKQRPWVHAKWAMSVDGRIATHNRHSKWISCDESRETVHRLRGRMDAVVTGAGTVRADDPLLIARPPGPRIPLRVVVDARAGSLTPATRLCQTIDVAPVLLFTGPQADPQHLELLRQCGVQIVETPEAGYIRQDDRIIIQPSFILAELGRRTMTNVLLEAGPGLLGTFFDADLIDEVHVFIAPKLIGGRQAIPVIGGMGRSTVPDLPSVMNVHWQVSGHDLLLQADVVHEANSCAGRG